jgi:phosphoribosyl 1,2-cyclic phosphodiesterase
VEHAGRRLGYATDLGHISDSLLDHFTDLHALAIESNYDRQMQVTSDRPGFLKHRIMGGAGHLSNDQCLEAVLHIEARSDLSQIALLHLSRDCNCPDRVRSMYARRAPHVLQRLTITSQASPTARLVVERWPHPRLVHFPPMQQQLRLFAVT